MKVKNIVFSGFAAVILVNVCGNAMAASVTFTSKTYVDEGLATKADVNALAEYTKTVDLADVATTGSYDDLKNKPTFPSLDGFVSKRQLEEVQAALEAAIADKQDKGEYLEAKDLTTLNEAITALQTGKADVSTVTELQNAIASLGNTYATKADMTAADEALQAAIENINLADYVKAVDVYTKNEADARFLVMRDANALGANLQWDEDGKLNTKGIVTADGLKELEEKVADAVTQTELDTFGYQTAKDVEGAITTATADLATKSELNAKQDKLTAGDNITIENGTISATVDLDGLATSQELTNLQTTLQAAIADKQDKGEYLEAKDLTTLNEAIVALQTGKADAQTVTDLQNAIDALGDKYATDEELGAAIAAVEAKIPTVPTKVSELENDAGYITNAALTGYAMSENVYTKGEADTKFLIMRDANALGANLQWDEDGKLNTKGIATADGLKELEDKVADAVTQTELDAIGYQTAKEVEDAITTATEDLATKSELNAKQDKLTAGDNITIENGTISATVDLEGLATSQELTNLQTALQAAIADKQDKGDYLVANDLTALNNAVNALQSGKADAQTVTDLQNAINALGDTYATDEEVSAAIAEVEKMIPTVPTNVSAFTNDAGYLVSGDLEDYAKLADVEATYATKESVAGLVTTEQLTNVQNALQTAIDGKQAAGEYAAAADLTALQEQVKALQEGGSTGVDTTELLTRIQTIEDTYATDAELTAAIDEVKKLIPSADSFATKDEIAGFMSTPSNPGMGSYLLYASCTNKKCNYSLKTIEELFPDVGGDVGGL